MTYRDALPVQLITERHIEQFEQPVQRIVRGDQLFKSE